jgi:CheY-like chemotaxis protein
LWFYEVLAAPCIIEHSEDEYSCSKRIGVHRVGANLLIAGLERPYFDGRHLNSDSGGGRIPHDAAQEQHRVTLAPSPGVSATIMLVEDEPMVRSLLARVLRSRGYTVIEAVDGLDALELATQREQPVDLLLTDVVMPRLGGIDLAAQMLAGGYVARVLYMTGYSDVTLHGVDVSVAVLRKPFAPRVLTEAVQRMLDT